MKQANPPQLNLQGHSALTKVENVVQNGAHATEGNFNIEAPSAKRVKMEAFVQAVTENGSEDEKVDSRDKVKGIALVKPE